MKNQRPCVPAVEREARIFCALLTALVILILFAVGCASARAQSFFTNTICASCQPNPAINFYVFYWSDLNNTSTWSQFAYVDAATCHSENLDGVEISAVTASLARPQLPFSQTNFVWVRSRTLTGWSPPSAPLATTIPASQPLPDLPPETLWLKPPVTINITTNGVSISGQK